MRVLRYDRHRLWYCAATQGGCVLVEGGVADQWELVLDGAPVLAQEMVEVGGVGVVRGEAGDAVGDFLAATLSVEAADVADDPEDLGGVGEVDRHSAMASGVDAVLGEWAVSARPDVRRAVAVDAKTGRGVRGAAGPARHLMAAIVPLLSIPADYSQWEFLEYGILRSLTCGKVFWHGRIGWSEGA
ncbi:MAG: hypothetical protein LC799_32160 [Actinobacteria bacterium]|nr:hypothetical protein [Actinomycetota bacterium]